MVNILGVVLIAIFFVGMLLFGISVSWRTRKSGQTSKSIMIGNNDIGLVVGTLTLSATWVGTAYIFSVSEQIYTPGAGLIWTQAPFCFLVCNLVGAFVFIPRLRDLGFITILDPMQNKLGKEINTVFYLVSSSTDIFWLAGILSTLGGSITVITGLESDSVAIMISACFAVVYTILGGLYAVAYTDVLQFGLIILGLILVTPFVLTNQAVGGFAETFENNSATSWVGTWDVNQTGFWIDTTLMMTLGYIAYQGLYQRVFAMKTMRKAQIATVMSSFIFLLAGIPAFLIGVAATKTDWTMAGYIDGVSNNNTPIENGQSKNIFPIMIQQLAPSAISFICLAAISAAAMSSADSAILSASSLFTRNIYKAIIRKNASDRELLWATRAAMLFNTALGAVLATALKSVYVLWVLMSDLLYVLIFPQFIGVLFMDPNVYGSVISLVLTLALRCASGEPLIGLPGLFTFPGNHSPNSQFPTKTFIMLFCLFTLALFSYVFKRLFQTKIIPKRFDFLDSNLAGKGRCYIDGKLNSVEAVCNRSFMTMEQKSSLIGKS